MDKIMDISDLLKELEEELSVIQEQWMLNACVDARRGNKTGDAYSSGVVAGLQQAIAALRARKEVE